MVDQLPMPSTNFFSPTTARKFRDIPSNATLQPEPFKVDIDEQKLSDMMDLVRLSPIAKETYENRDANDWRFGVPREYMVNSKQGWLERFDWRVQETFINTFPNFKTTITDDDGQTYSLHFVALFSKKQDAIPIAFFHGWPGSFYEFLTMLDHVRRKYKPDTLPYHIIVPSLPGFTFSQQPPIDRDWGIADSARLMHKLLLSLGFGEKGYVVQGGDIGSYIARTMAVKYKECKAMHLNFMQMLSPPDHVKKIPLNERDREGVQRGEEFQKTGTGYGRMHAHRPATISHVLSASPLALFAWMAEKFYQWSDEPHISLQTVLTNVCLYWLTDSFPTSIYTYREDFSATDPHSFHGRDDLRVNKPMGYSLFRKEILPVPEDWAKATGLMKFFRLHEKGGHFAALEMGEALWEDVETFVEREKLMF